MACTRQQKERKRQLQGYRPSIVFPSFMDINIKRPTLCTAKWTTNCPLVHSRRHSSSYRHLFFFLSGHHFPKGKKKTCIFRTNCPSQRFRSLFFLFFQPCSSLLASSFFFSVVSFINFIFRSFEGGNHPSRSPDVIQSLARVTLLRFPKLRMTDASERRHKRKDRLEIHRLECFYLLFSTCAYTHTMAIHPRAWP